MLAEEMRRHLGAYVFLVVEGGRSFPCDVLRVTEDEVLAVEVTHNACPLTLRRVPLPAVVYVFTGDGVETALGFVDDVYGPAGSGFTPGEVVDFFASLRVLLNGDDREENGADHLGESILPAEPTKKKRKKKGKAA